MVGLRPSETDLRLPGLSPFKPGAGMGGGEGRPGQSETNPLPTHHYREAAWDT